MLFSVKNGISGLNKPSSFIRLKGSAGLCTFLIMYATLIHVYLSALRDFRRVTYKEKETHIRFNN